MSKHTTSGMARINLSVGQFTRLAVVLICAVVLGACSRSSGLTLNYSDHDPLGGMRTQFVQEVWLPEISRQSNDEIEVRDFWGGALLSSKEILKGVGDGVADLGMVYPGHYPRQLVAHSVFSLFPRGPTDFADMIELYRRAYAEIPALADELRRVNVMPLMITAGLPGAFASTSSLETLDDVAGRRWRGGGKWPLRYLENVGAVPVAVPWGDTYMALQTGTLDGALANYDGMHMTKLDEAAPNVLISRELWYALPFLHVVNLRRFERLPAEARAAMLRAAEVAEREFAGTYERAFEEIRSTQLALGYTVNEISSDDLARWENTDALLEMRAEWIREAESVGLENASDVMEKVTALHKEVMMQ